MLKGIPEVLEWNFLCSASDLTIVAGDEDHANWKQANEKLTYKRGQSEVNMTEYEEATVHCVSCSQLPAPQVAPSYRRRCSDTGW